MKGVTEMREWFVTEIKKLMVWRAECVDGTN
jgi:hypothetical protein